MVASPMKTKERIADLLAAYGSDLDRWPIELRSEIDRIDPNERDALMREHRAFDRLLSRAATETDAAVPSEALMARIMAARTNETIEREPIAAARTAAVQDKVVILRRPTRDVLAAASLMAASLVVGFFVGSTDLGRTTTAKIGEMAGLNAASASVQTTLLDDALQLHDDEDLFL